MRSNQEPGPVSEEIQRKVDMVLGTTVVARHLGLAPIDRSGSIAYFEAAQARRQAREGRPVDEEK